MNIERWDPAKDGPLSETALRRKLEASGHQVRRHVYLPGMYFPAHTHKNEDLNAVFSGCVRVSWANGSAVLGFGDIAHVPAGTKHTAEVIGRDPAVSLNAVIRDN